MCQYGIIDCDGCPTLVGDTDNGGGCAYVLAGRYVETLYFLLNFAMTLKLFLGLQGDQTSQS